MKLSQNYHSETFATPQMMKMTQNKALVFVQRNNILYSKSSIEKHCFTCMGYEKTIFHTISLYFLK